MGLHKRHLVDDNFTGEHLRHDYRPPEPSLSAKIADAIGMMFSGLLAAFRKKPAR